AESQIEPRSTRYAAPPLRGTAPAHTPSAPLLPPAQKSHRTSPQPPSRRAPSARRRSPIASSCPAVRAENVCAENMIRIAGVVKHSRRRTRLLLSKELREESLRLTSPGRLSW